MEDVFISEPVYPEFPDASRKGSLDAQIKNGEATIQRIDVGSLYERQGVGKNLIHRLMEKPEVTKILANPTEEARKKKFYESIGFQWDDERNMFVWTREPRT